MSHANQILCAKCREPVVLAIDAAWRATVSCPSCGEFATFDAAAEEAKAEFADRLVREAEPATAQAPRKSRARRYRFVFVFSPR